jgi:hypothetical protein
MSATEFIQFLGHSSIYEPFDAFLSANKITKRPKVGRTLDTKIFVDGSGLVLNFDFSSSAKKEKMEIKSEGDFVFNRFTIHLIANDKKHGKYTGVMPFDLSDKDTRESVEKKLGSPTRSNDGGANYYLDGHVWTVVFQNQFIYYCMIELPRDGLRKYGLCP